MMNKRIFSAVPVLLTTFIGIQAFAETPQDVRVVDEPQMRVVGFTDETSDGYTNSIDRHKQCRAKFRNGVWCSTRDYVEGAVAPQIVNTSAEENPNPSRSWIQPTIISSFPDPDHFNEHRQIVWSTDISGLTEQTENLSCNQWIDDVSPGLRGTILTFVGKTPTAPVVTSIFTADCTESLPSACCAPTVKNWQ